MNWLNGPERHESCAQVSGESRVALYRPATAADRLVQRAVFSSGALRGPRSPAERLAVQPIGISFLAVLASFRSLFAHPIRQRKSMLVLNHRI